MDAVVGNSALVTLIMEEIYIPTSEEPTVEEEEANKCLSQCARVNKLWHVESCRFLWKRQPKLANVLRLLFPNTSLLNAKEKRSYETCNITLSRFLHYSKWICHLICSDLEDSDNLNYANLLAQGKTLFPRLETLSLSFDRTPSFTGITALALLSPTLKSIHFDSFCPPKFAAFLLERLELKSIQLNVLLMADIPSPKTSHDDQRCLLDVISQQQSITFLNLHPSWVDYDVFCAVASLPRLSTLEIQDSESLKTPVVANSLYDDAVLNRLKWQESWFPSLTDLLLYITWFAGMKLLKSVFASAKLSLITLWLRYRFRDQIGERLVFLPASLRSPTSMIDIDIQVGENDSPLTPRLTAASLSTLSDCSQLQFLTVHASRIPQMDDNGLLALIQNWPCLLVLHFTDMRCIIRSDTTTFSLALIAKIPAICHELLTLSLPVSLSTESLDVHRPEHQELQVLNLGTSFFLDSQSPDWNKKLIPIAAYLAAVTPSTCKIDFCNFGKESFWREMPDAEWDMLVAAHLQTKSSIYNHIRAIRISQGIDTALNDTNGHYTVTFSD